MTALPLKYFCGKGEFIDILVLLKIFFLNIPTVFDIGPVRKWKHSVNVIKLRDNFRKKYFGYNLSQHQNYYDVIYYNIVFHYDDVIFDKLVSKLLWKFLMILMILWCN